MYKDKRLDMNNIGRNSGMYKCEVAHTRTHTHSDVGC